MSRKIRAAPCREDGFMATATADEGERGESRWKRTNCE